MMIIKGKWEIPKADGSDYEELEIKNSAEMISFSDTTLAAALDNLSNGKISHASSVEFAEVAEKDSAGNILTDTYLTLASAAMTGTPTAPTNSDTSCIATTEFMQGKIREICGDVESGMTLARLIESINKNPNFAADIARELTGKQNFSTRFDDLKNLPADVIPYFDGEKFVGAPITAQGKKILAATDIEHFRWIIQATANKEFAWDETEKIHWLKTGNPTITTANARFSKALQVDANNKLYSQEKITFGGTPFTIDLWAYCAAKGYTSTYFPVVAMGSDLSFGTFEINDPPKHFRFNNNEIGNIFENIFHVEVCYSNGSAKLFMNGVLKNTVAMTISRAARQITFGGDVFSAISSFRILDGVCLHTGNFAVPNKPYELTDETVTCINF